MERNGIISVGNWVVDSVKFIDVYPSKGNLTTIRGVEEGLGGCAHNVLVDLARLESGVPLYAGGCVGDDDHGRMCLDAIRKYHIDPTNMRVLKDEKTSYTDVMSETTGSSSRTFFHYRGANAKLTKEMVMSVDCPARIFHLGYLLLLDEMDKEDSVYGTVAARVLDALQKKGFKTSVDVVSEEGDRYRKVVLPCLKYTDYLIVNEVEAGACLGRDLRENGGGINPENVKAAALDLLGLGVREMVVIHYPEGGVAVTREQSAYEPSYVPDGKGVVSSVGAGDAFCAGALYAIHEGFGLSGLLTFANACARFNLLCATSTGGAPTKTQVIEYINSQQ